MTTSSLKIGSFASLDGWRDAAPDAPYAAFRQTAERLVAGNASASPFAVEPARYADAVRAALDGTMAPRAFFETHFEPALVVPTETTRGFVTGYYEPVVEASPVRTDRFTVPLHRPPADLVRVGSEYGRRAADGGLSEHFDRAAIARGALDGEALEIAWLADPVDAFFIHVQGSARLQLPGGNEIRVGFAGKSGHRFTAIGRVLVSEGELVLEKADMAGIRAWLAAHPVEVRRLLDRNRSYIYFEPRAVDDPREGPIGAAGVPLTALASLAIDPAFHAYGSAIFVSAPDLAIDEAPFRRLMVAQDTGSAIVGPARGDLFIGTGAAAGAIAGTVRHPADFHLLVPRGSVR